MNDPLNPAGQDLRRRAQERLESLGMPASLEGLSAALHELRLYQVELEIQNEELIAARAGLEASQEKYFRHFDLAPVGLIRLSKEALVLEANILGAQMLGREAFKRRPQLFILSVAPQWHLDFQQHLDAALASGKMETCELALRQPSGVEMFVRMQSVRSRGEGEVAELYVTLTDLSERRGIERRLATQQAELRGEMAARLRLEKEVLSICEREQCRLGTDLHDGLGQHLAGIALLVKVLSNQLLGEGHPGAGPAIEIANLSRDTIDIARNLAKGLYPIDLEQDGLLGSLEILADQTRERFRINCVFRRTGPALGFEKSAEIHLYRIVQESISNAIKHACARSIVIEYNTEDGTHCLSVTDDGAGIPAVKDHVPGIGLRLMQYRARLIDAVVTLERPVTGGCKVVCRFRSPEVLPAGFQAEPRPPTICGSGSFDPKEAATQIYADILTSIAELAYIFDPSGRLVYANKPLLDLWGLELKDATGKTFHELQYPAPLAEKLQRQIDEVVKTGTVLRDGTLYTSPKGITGYFEYVFSPVFANDGTVEVVAGSTRDTARRRHIEERLRDSDRRKDEFLAMLL